jgi:hypothetical protein
MTDPHRSIYRPEPADMKAGKKFIIARMCGALRIRSCVTSQAVDRSSAGGGIMQGRRSGSRLKKAHGRTLMPSPALTLAARF